MSTKKNRTELKEYFVAEAQPTENQFAEFIDSTLNQIEDGIKKSSVDPLAIKATGDNVGPQEVMQFYTDFNEEAPNWALNLNPRVNATEPSTNKEGLNIKDGTGESRMFIQSGKGNVGIGTIEPNAKLTVESKNETSLVSVINTTNKRTEILEVSQENGSGELTVRNGEAVKEAKLNGNSIVFQDNTNTVTPTTTKIAATGENLTLTASNVKITGNIAMNNLSVNETLSDNGITSDATIPSQKAVKTYIDNRLPKGLISMWSGAEIPEGWALCDGQEERPDLRGRFVVGFDKDNPEYNQTKKTGGFNNITLNTSQIPAHSHTGETSQNGAHTHGFSHKASDNTDGSAFSTFTMDGENKKTINFNTESSGNHKHSFTTTNTGGNQSHENRPPYYVLAYIIKL